MSPVRRASSSSLASCSSMRLRSRIMGCESWGFDHSEGSESFFSIAANSDLRRGASKILPQVADFVAHGSVGEFKIVQHDERTRLFLETGRRLKQKNSSAP